MNENVREKIHGIMMVAMSFKDRHPHIRDSVMGEYAEGLTEDVMGIMREAMLSDKTLMELRFVDDVREGMEAAFAVAGFAEKEQGNE